MLGFSWALSPESPLSADLQLRPWLSQRAAMSISASSEF